MKIKYSFIIPVSDDERVVNLLRSLDNFKGNKNSHEVVVICNNSLSKFVELIKDELSQRSFYCRLMEIKTKNIAKARNMGIRNSISDVLIFIDSDCLLPHSYLETLESIIKSQKNSNEIIRGKVIFKSSSWFNKLCAKTREITYDSHPELMFAPNIIIPKRFFKKHGFYNELMDYGVDSEWGQRLSYHKVLPIYEPNLYLYHFEDQKFSKTLKTWFKYGVGMAYRLKRNYYWQKKSFFDCFCEMVLFWKGFKFKKEFSLIVVELFYKTFLTIGVIYALLFKWKKYHIYNLK